MHKLIHSLVLGAADESPPHNSCGSGAQPHQTSHFRLDPGRKQEAYDEDLAAARLPKHLHQQHRDTSWRPVKLSGVNSTPADPTLRGGAAPKGAQTVTSQIFF